MQLRDWFLARYSYLQVEYLNAINAADNIVGKQGQFDQRPRLTVAVNPGAAGATQKESKHG